MMGFFAKIKAAWRARKIIREATMEKNGKPGWKTTEFWLTLLAQAPMIACTLGGHESVPCLVAGVLATLSYHYQRGGLKGKLVEIAKTSVETKTGNGPDTRLDPGAG